MSILIKGMKMPKCCDDCDFIQHGVGDWCYITEKNLPCDCPLIELPDHGDLIDRDALYDDDSWEWFNEWGSTVNQQARLVADAPVVIPAERSEE